MSTKIKASAKKVVQAQKQLENNQDSKRSKVKKKAAIEGHGGARKRAGRKEGAATKKTREIADKLAADGELTPLEYLLGVMRTTDEDLKKQFDNGDLDISEYMVKLETLQRRRDNAAEKAAPFVHARLASISSEVKVVPHEDFLDLMNN